MKIRVAHLREQGIDFVVFDADSPSRTASGRHALLQELAARARRAGLKVDKAALQFAHNRGLQFVGTPDLVDFLASKGGVQQWTHTITV